MTINSLGDLARAFAMRQHSATLKQNIQSLNEELVTGTASDLTDHLGGSYARLTGIERELRLLDGYSVTISEAEQFTGLMQARLEQVNDIAGNFARDLIATDASSSVVTSETIAEEGRQQFETVVAMLNSQAAGRSMFAGDTTDRAPLVAGDLILAELETIVAGATTATDIETAVNNWFADPLGFDAFAYTGSNTALAPFKMSDTAEASVDIKANDPALKDVMKSFAMAALATAPGTTLPLTEQTDLYRQAGESMLAAERDMVETQARLGLAQELVDDWSVRNQTETAGLEYAKGALMKIDPYEAATELEAAQFQLESLYAVTVRLSQLSLVNFLR